LPCAAGRSFAREVAPIEHQIQIPPSNWARLPSSLKGIERPQWITIPDGPGGEQLAGMRSQRVGQAHERSAAWMRASSSLRIAPVAELRTREAKQDALTVGEVDAEH